MYTAKCIVSTAPATTKLLYYLVPTERTFSTWSRLPSAFDIYDMSFFKTFSHIVPDYNENKEGGSKEARPHFIGAVPHVSQDYSKCHIEQICTSQVHDPEKEKNGWNESRIMYA